MHRILGLALLSVGLVLLILGINSSESPMSSFSELFTGQPTDRAVWFLLGGAVALAAGVGFTFFGKVPH
jgi:hypothetical protein